ncbi:MAG: hypothetical protein ABDH28_03200 [Brevinematia bacterium]
MKAIKAFLSGVGNFFKNSFLSITKPFKEIRKKIIIRKAEREITEKLTRFKSDFDSFMNEYYEYLPLPQGKSIIQNTLKSGKTFYLIVFNDVRKKYASVLEIFSDPYFPLPLQYNLLQRIDITTFMDKIRENMQNKLENKKKAFLN